jgi:hypothetical protein
VGRRSAEEGGREGAHVHIPRGVGRNAMSLINFPWGLTVGAAAHAGS